MSRDIAEACKSHVWYQQVLADEPLGDAKTMLSEGERRMLHWLARNKDLSDGGCIVDAGCFLGGSTLSLATGLRKNEHFSSKEYRIHSYDIFIAPNDAYSMGMIGEHKKPGDTVLDIFAANLGRYSSNVVVHSGDLIETPPPQRHISILFIDIAKTRELNAKMVREFFPLLVAGNSIVVQQDHNDHSCPWVNATMECLRDYFDVLCDDGGSRVYQLKSEIPSAMLARAASISLQEEFDYLRQLAGRDASPFAKFFTAVSAAWTVLEKDGVEAATSYIDSIDIDQPWKSDAPYVDMVKASIEWIGSPEGLHEFHTNYFAETA